jgi:ethanolamine utilization cobalamin adenosyltransferase
MMGTMTSEKAHPIQPLIHDERGVLRFKENAIVKYLLDAGGIDMNMLAIMPFSQEDRIQFAQLIGYSHSGAADLSYMPAEVIDVAHLMHEAGKTETEARNEYLRMKLDEVKRLMRPAIAELFDVGPDFDEI